MKGFASRTLFSAAIALWAFSAAAQITPAAGVTPPDDTPSVKLGGTVFGQYSWIQSPKSTDVAGNSIHNSAFDVTRAYINITGNVNHLIAYRITPDIARESGSGSSLAGSAEFRLKYAFGQFNLDDWTTKGSWVRLGIQQTPFVDYEEGVYRYRFQGPVFVDREGYLSSSDAGVSGRWVFPQGYGEVHAGFYNGENYNKTETNNQKAFQIRASVRPMPLGGVWKGLRLTAFMDADKPVAGGKRQRTVLNATFEHPLVNAGFDYLQTQDRALPTAGRVDGKGWSAWVTPKLPDNFELLFRHDQLKPNKTASNERKRDIAGISYWFPSPKGTTAALLLDYDSLKQTNFSPAKADDTRYGVKLLLNF